MFTSYTSLNAWFLYRFLMLLFFSCDVKRGEGGGYKVNVTLMLIFPKILWKRLLKVEDFVERAS